MTFLGKFGYIMYVYKLRICDALRDYVPFVQFKKREKHPWRSVTFNKVAGWSLNALCATHHINTYVFILKKYKNIKYIYIIYEYI